jgi:hypothetical protein
MRHLERAVIAALGVWCVLGVGHTTRSLLGPAGWAAGRPEVDVGFVGMPLQDAGAVVTIGRLLEVRPGVEDPALVILPDGMDSSRELYFRFQLAYTRFPRRVDVVAASAVATPGSPYATVIAVTGTQLEAPWRVTATSAGFTAWEQEGS